VKKLVDAIKNLLIGLGITAKHFPRKHITLQYPDERWPMPERSRGVVVLLSDKETGELNCTACLLCMRSCPTAAIRIEFEKDEKGKRSLKQFHVDNTLCCYCGLCEEACPTLAIQLTPDFEYCTGDILKLVAEKEDLLVDHGGKNRQYNFYRYAGITTALGGKGTHVDESQPVKIRSNLP